MDRQTVLWRCLKYVCQIDCSRLYVPNGIDQHIILQNKLSIHCRNKCGADFVNLFFCLSSLTRTSHRTKSFSTSNFHWIVLRFKSTDRKYVNILNGNHFLVTNIYFCWFCKKYKRMNEQGTNKFKVGQWISNDDVRILHFAHRTSHTSADKIKSNMRLLICNCRKENLPKYTSKF